MKNFFAFAALFGGLNGLFAQMANVFELPGNNTIVYDVAQTSSGQLLLATGPEGLWLWSPNGNAPSKIYNDPVLLIEPWNNQYLIANQGAVALIDSTGNVSPLNTNGYLLNSLITDIVIESDSTFFALFFGSISGNNHPLYHYAPSTGFTSMNKAGSGIALYKGLLHLSGSRTAAFEVYNGTNWWPQNTPVKGYSSWNYTRLVPINSDLMYVVGDNFNLYLYDGDTLHHIPDAERISGNRLEGRFVRKNIFLHQNSLYTITQTGIQIVDSMSTTRFPNQNFHSPLLLHILDNGCWAFYGINLNRINRRTWMEMGILEKEVHDKSQALMKNHLWEVPLLSTGNIGQSMDSSYAVRFNDKMVYADNHLYMGALVNGVPRTVVEDYRGILGFGYSSGPISNQYDADYLRRYTRVWTVSSADVEHHKNNFNKPGYTAPSAIVSWPGNGRSQFGESPMLAPFVDLNGNGRYEPKLGEHPEMKGDQMAFVIFNDQRNPKINNGAAPLGAEVHLSVYLFDSTKSEDLQNSVFVNYKIFNRSAETWTDFTIGMPWMYWMGTNADGLLLSDSTRAMAGVVKDEPYDTSNINGWGSFPPAIVFRGLSTPIDGVNFFSDRRDIEQYGYPKTNSDAWNYLNHRWKDGTQQSRWFNEISRPPLLVASWLRSYIILPTVTLGTVHPGNFTCFDYCFSLNTDSVGVFSDILAPLYAAQNRTDAVQSFFDANSLRCFSQAISVVDIAGISQSVVVYPNPAEAGSTLHLSGLDALQDLSLTNILGQTFPVSHQKMVTQHFAIQLPHNLAPGIYFLMVGGSQKFQVKVQII